MTNKERTKVYLNAVFKLKFILEHGDKDDMVENADAIHSIFEDVYEARLWDELGKSENAVPVCGRILDENGADTGVTFDLHDAPPNLMANEVSLKLELLKRQN